MKSIPQNKLNPFPPYEIKPGKIRGLFPAPPSKSISHRLLILGALTQKPSRIHNVLFSEDVLITLEALRKMGFQWEKQDNSIVFSGIRKPPAGVITIDLGNSGTSTRLLTAIAAALPGEYLFRGSPRMQERPMSPLINALRALGVCLEHRDGYLPLKLKGTRIRGGKVEIDTSQSSQFLSALMMLAPLTREGMEISSTGAIVSESYVQLTKELLKTAGIRIQQKKGLVIIAGDQKYQLTDAKVEGDYSSASYFAVGSAISGGSVCIENLYQNSVQGDRAVLDFLKAAGARIFWRDDQVCIEAGNLKGIDVNMNSQPDLVPTLAVMSLFVQGQSRLRAIEHLRFKETDRLNAIIGNIQKLRGKILLDGNDLIIKPVPLVGSTLPTFDDHRIAMSFALAGLRIPGIKIENPGCVNKSFPEFWNYFESLKQMT
ncbi:MAG: 3-phosphoshikimate 1-carboxyvinyltransferase [bacterium]|nr:MAG: 3-phosphoshikimate 1-carboxyvinyltransferase [bacterium]